MTIHDTYFLIWEAVRSIPRGKVATYGDVARASGLPGRARQVGYALHNLPHGSEIPWHRVVNAGGRVSLPKTGGHYERQKRLLVAEGIIFRRETIDLERYRWQWGKRTSKARSTQSKSPTAKRARRGRQSSTS